MPDNDIGWGQGAVNNDIGWGKGASNNNINWGAICSDSPSGDTNLVGGSSFTNTRSLLFDAVDDEVVIPSYDIPTESTISFWVKSGLSSPQDIIISGVAGHYYPYLLLSGGNIRLIIKAGAASNEIISNVTWVADTWFHIAITGTGGQGAGTTATYYINGVNKGTSLNRTPTLTKIGSYTSASLKWNGNIDEVAFFNSVLSASDISSIYNSGVPSDLSSFNPVRWYRFEEGTGTTAIDSGSDSSNGTLVNGVAYSTDVPN